MGTTEYNRLAKQQMLEHRKAEESGACEQHEAWVMTVGRKPNSGMRLGSYNYQNSNRGTQNRY